MDSQNLVSFRGMSRIQSLKDTVFNGELPCQKIPYVLQRPK